MVMYLQNCNLISVTSSFDFKSNDLLQVQRVSVPLILQMPSNEPSCPQSQTIITVLQLWLQKNLDFYQSYSAFFEFLQVKSLVYSLCACIFRFHLHHLDWLLKVRGSYRNFGYLKKGYALAFRSGAPTLQAPSRVIVAKEEYSNICHWMFSCTQICYQFDLQQQHMHHHALVF